MDKKLKEQIKERYMALVGIVEKAIYEYYQLCKPTLTDFEFDMYYKELEKIEEKYPEIKIKDSPTNKVGCEDLTKNKFKTIKHDYPMLSLSNSYNKEDIFRFFGTEQQEYFIEPKYDGASVSLIYEKGVLKQAVSRGNGKAGEDITDNVIKIINIPKSIPIKDKFEVRGEAVMFHKDFDKINEERKAQGKDLFSNCRNAAAGMLRLKNNSEVKGLSFLAYLIPLELAIKHQIKTQEEMNDKLISLGFTSGQCYKVSKTSEIAFYLDSIGSKKDTLEYDIDGAVIKVNDLKKQMEIGNATKYPKWATAFKYPQETSYTKLKSVTYQVGKFGNITPVAELEPVEIDGSVIQRATLHNFDEIKRLGIKIGDQVAVEKAAAIIPKITGYAAELRTGKEIEITTPDVCPICGSTLKKKEGEVAIKCTNFECPERMKGLIKSFVSKEGLDIEGFGESNVDLFYETGLITKQADIFELINKEDELLALPKFAKKKVENIIAAIKDSVNKTPQQAVYALQIETLGESVSNIIIEHYGTFDEVLEASQEELSSIQGIGNVCAENIKKTIDTEYFKNLYKTMKEFGIKFGEEKIEKEKIDSPISGKTFCITGTLCFGTRSEFEKMIKEKGGIPKSTVTKTLDYLIAGDDVGSKLEKAISYGVKILSEKEFMILIK